MYKLFYGLLTIIWLFDAFNFPQFEILDTTYPINFWMWLLIFMLLPPTATIKRGD